MSIQYVFCQCYKASAHWETTPRRKSMFAKLRVQTECTSIFCQELMSVTTLTETLLKRSKKPQAAIWGNQRAGK